VTREREFGSAGAVPSSRWPADSLRRLAEGSAVSLTVSTAEEMRELGRRLASAAAAGDLVILSGGLGAGKTTLTKGIGDGLGVRGPITSPTFVIARVHPPVGPGQGGPGPSLVHADAYRLGGVLELDDLDLDTDLASSVTVVEWGEGLAEGLSADRLEIAIETLPMGGVDPADPDDLAGDTPRTVRITPVGQRWEGIELPLLGLADRL
jgi:tRNA threonylcarbamoyladenosine biosynthesis protein TsaE